MYVRPNVCMSVRPPFFLVAVFELYCPCPTPATYAGRVSGLVTMVVGFEFRGQRSKRVST